MRATILLALACGLAACAVADPLKPCVEAVAGPILKLKARARGQTQLSYSWHGPRGDWRRGDVCVDYYERSVHEEGAPDAVHFSKDAISPGTADGEFSESWEDLLPGTEYRVTVRAVNAKYGPGPASTASVRTRGSPDDERPPGPVLFADVARGGGAAGGASGGVVITWSPPTSGGWATRYEVIVSDPQGKRLVDGSVDKPRLEVSSGLRQGVRYVLLVAAANHAGRGPMSRVYFTTNGAAASAEGVAAA